MIVYLEDDQYRALLRVAAKGIGVAAQEITNSSNEQRIEELATYGAVYHKLLEELRKKELEPPFIPTGESLSAADARYLADKDKWGQEHER